MNKASNSPPCFLLWKCIKIYSPGFHLNSSCPMSVSPRGCNCPQSPIYFPVSSTRFKSSCAHFFAKSTTFLSVIGVLTFTRPEVASNILVNVSFPELSDKGRNSFPAIFRKLSEFYLHTYDEIETLMNRKGRKIFSEKKWFSTKEKLFRQTEMESFEKKSEVKQIKKGKYSLLVSCTT